MRCCWSAATAYVESAQACGLHLLTSEERNPNTTTSYGLGLLIAAAVESGAREVVIGLGGSAVNDGGAGMLAALGAAPVDVGGYALPYGGAVLRQRRGSAVSRSCAASTWSPPPTSTTPWSGCTAPATSTARRRAPSREDVLRLDAALEHFSAVLEKGLGAVRPVWPRCPAAARPAGSVPPCSRSAAAGCPGIALVTGLIGLEAELDAADLVITGRGVVRSPVAARQGGRPGWRTGPATVACPAWCSPAGSTRAAARLAQAGVTETYALVEHFGSQERAMTRGRRRPASARRPFGGAVEPVIVRDISALRIGNHRRAG